MILSSGVQRQRSIVDIPFLTSKSFSTTAYAMLLTLSAKRFLSLPSSADARYAWAAAILFLFVSTFWIAVGHGQRSGWVLMTLPQSSSEWGHTCLGLSSLYGHTLIHGENWYSVMDSLFMVGTQGVESVVGFTLFRAYYPFAVGLLSSELGLENSFVIVNALAWALCVAATWVLSLRLYRSRQAAFFSALLATGGIGMSTHIHDYSAHFLGFASVYWGIVWTYRSGVWKAYRPWITHLHLGVYFGVASLVYGSGLLLTMVYLVTAWRRNRLLHVAGAAAMAMTARPLWIHALHAMGTTIPDVESAYLHDALISWAKTFHHSPILFLKTLLLYTSEFLSLDCPTTVFLGFFSLFFVMTWREGKALGLAVLGVPIGMGLLFAPIASARGYLIYGSSLWIYAGAGLVLSRLLACSPPWRGIARCVVVMAIAVQFVWSSAFLFGQTGPVRMYFRGWDHGALMLLHRPTRAVSMTGLEPTPILYGGHANPYEAGSIPVRDTIPHDRVAFSGVLACLHQLPLVLFLSLFLIVWVPQDRLKVVLGGFLLLWCISLFGQATRGTEIPGRFAIGNNLCLPSHATLLYTVHISPHSLQVLEHSEQPLVDMAIFIPFMNTAPQVSLLSGPVPVRCSFRSQGDPTLCYLTDIPAALQTLADYPTLSIQLTNPSSDNLYLEGWQRLALEGRELSSTQSLRLPGALANRPLVLPAFELRTYSSDGTLVACAF